MWTMFLSILLMYLVHKSATSVINCKQTGKGLEYRGTISVTIYGKTCQRWDSQTPHAHIYDKDLPGNASVHENYCRNPRASDETVPWCYTTDKNIRWQYCGVPYCEVDFSKCKLTSEGLDYRGNVSRTASGKTCQRWDKQYPWTHTYTDLYGGNSVHENYCRNPKAGQDPTPWCYTTDDKVQWELCDIPVCECRDTQKGEAYIGKTSQTVDGRQCVRWDSVDDSHPDYFNVKFLTGSKSTHENYCRNPDNKIAPWCFTELVGGSWNYCNIPFCKRSSAECLTSPKGFDYFGTENRTVDNIECQRWDTVKPHQHSFSKGFMGLSASEHENYCRNPNDDKMPWCYTVNSKIKFQYCNIPNCPERDCKITEIGINYRGKQRTTRGGILCQRWDRTYPHIPNPSISFAASSLSAQENYCRNPDSEPAPWCYTMNPTVRWQLCDVPFCFNDSYSCVFSKENCSFEQLNNNAIKWVLKAEEGKKTRVLTLAEDLPSVQSALPSLRLPKMRFTKTGSCLQMNYRSRGIRLNISTDKQNLTSLSSSDEWKLIKVNIDYSNDTYQIIMTPTPITSSVNFAIKDVYISNTPCEDCFACLNDGSCIENGKFCDMSMDCLDNSDEKNCVLECYTENKYEGFRKKTKFLHQCADAGKCKFDSQSKGKPGCSINSEKQWEECSIPKCKSETLNCNFKSDMCNWKVAERGVKWNRHTSEIDGEEVITAKMLNSNEERRAILYSAPQLVSTDIGCLTMSYLGKDVHLQLYITQGTVYTPKTMVFERRDIDSKLFATTSIQTPTNIPYMVILVGTLKANRSGTIQIGKINYENGICADKDPCSLTQFQCEDGSCIPVGDFCNGLTNCANQEDESACKYNNNTSCLEYNSGCPKRCPAHCQCNGFIFKCSSPENVTKEVKMIWYIALFSVVGNAYVIYYRIQEGMKSNASHGIFVLHLSVSDFLMGVYLFIIAIADLEYRNVYGFNDGEWRYSTTCTIAGLLATTSSEASVIFICLITIERYIVLKHPFSAGFVKKRRVILSISFVAWLIAILFSVIPVLVYPDFYSRSTVCISLPLTPEKVSGWEYSTFLFIGFNMFIFMAIVIGQLLIFIQVKRMGKKINNDNSKREMAVLKSLSYVVLSDTFCWIPIIVIGLLASGGVNISSDVYAWVIVLVLPINSALNPFIYTFSMIFRQKKKSPRSPSVTLSGRVNGQRQSSK
uniref:Plasminogen n=1 Tax=Magallana gigas TaxID=29159 RepID=A0A8W8KR10_MAGGI